MRRALALAPAWLALLGGCGGGGELSARAEEPPPGPQPTIESIQEEVFTPRCASCHTGGSAPQGLRLNDARTSYSNLVSVRSSQMPLRMRVEPGDPEASYLIDKLEGTNVVGDRMPPGGEVTPERLAAIREWITRGAAPPAQEPEAVFLPAMELPAP